MKNINNNGQRPMLKHMVKVRNRPIQKQIVKWCNAHCEHRYTVFLGWDYMEWRFEGHKDAVWFALRWSEI